MLVVLAGLPGVGKTTIARELAPRLVAMHLRIDSIEDAIRRADGYADRPMADAGYQVAYAVAEDNLRLGQTVLADCVNPWPETRDAWIDVAARVGIRCVEVEIVCSDAHEHERRIETRRIEEGAGVTWQQVLARDYRHWTRDRLVVDTAGRTALESVQQLITALAR